MSLHPSRRAALVAATAAILAGGVAIAPSASASNVAWSVSVGGPGFAVSAGQPGFRGGAVWGGGFRPINGGCFNCGWNRPWFRPVVPAPILVPPPVFAPIVVAPRRVFVPAPVFRPRVVVARGYWPR